MRQLPIGLILVLTVSTGACSVADLLNQTATFGPEGGGSRAGATIGSGNRGTIQVIIENNTPFRAVFTYGVFDNTDERSRPVFLQFSPNSQLTGVNSTSTLEGNTNSGVVTLPCARVFAIGSPSLLNLLEQTGAAGNQTTDRAALLDGVGFSDVDASDPAAADPNQGFAPAHESLLGVDFNCGSLLLVRLEFNDAGGDPFRVITEVIPSGDP